MTTFSLPAAFSRVGGYSGAGISMAGKENGRTIRPPRDYSCTKSPSAEAIDTLVDQASRMPPPFSVVLLEPKGRAIGRVKEDEMAIGGRDAAHTVYAFAIWEDPAETDAQIG